MQRRKRSSLNSFALNVAGLAISLWIADARRPVAAFAANAGTSGADILTTPISARAVGMGDAYSAVSDDVSAIHWNPAGLAMIQQQQISTMYLKGVLDINTEFLGYALPLPPELTITESGISAIGASVLLSQLGTIEVPRTDANGLMVDNNTISVGNNEVFSATYGTLISKESLSFIGPEENYIGVTGRYVVSTLAQNYTARTAAFDLGYLNVWKNQGIRWALLAQNLGPDIKYKTQGDPLPVTYRVGFAWQRELPHIAASPVTLSLDGIMDREGKKSVHGGAEYLIANLVAVRGGYQGGEQQVGGLTAGVGIKVPELPLGDTPGWLTLDYGFMLMGELGNTHRISLTLGFGGSSKAARARNYTVR